MTKNKLYKMLVVLLYSFLGVYAYNNPSIDKLRVFDRIEISNSYEVTGSSDEINFALEVYGIKSSHVDKISFDENLYSRGEYNVVTNEVSIGPAALVSWGVLGSTLIHEVEVHGNQGIDKKILLGWQEKLLGKSSLAALEIEAYESEVRNSHRLGVHIIDLNGIKYHLQEFKNELKNN